MFDALYLEKSGDGFSATRRLLTDDQLAAATPDADVTVRIEYSTINFKDALALANRSPVVRRWPMVPGIDGAGVVESSSHPGFAAGDRVILNGWGVGETHWGCLAQRARLKGDWLVAMPAGIDARRAMAIGTAGYTAMLCVMALGRRGVTPAHGEVLVTGAAGGVGSVAMSLSMDALATPRVLYYQSVDFAAMGDFDLSEIETPRRALPLDLPEPCRLLLELVDADASRLDMAGALDLLTQSGLAAEFDDLFRHAADLGLSVEVIAAIVLARILGGPLGEFVSGDAQVALASLQERVREATDALQQMGRHGVALARRG